MEETRQVAEIPENAYAVQADVLLARVVVDEADRRVAERRRAKHLLDHQLRGVPGADHERFLASSHDPPWQRALDQGSREHAHTSDEGETEQEVDEPDTAGNARAVDREDREDEVDRERGETDSAQRAPDVAGRDVTPPPVVEA